MNTTYTASLDAESVAAFNSEYDRDWAKSCVKHQEVVKKLQPLLQSKSIDKLGRATIERQLKYHQERVTLLSSKQGQGPNAQILFLPTAESARRELLEEETVVPISLTQLSLPLNQAVPSANSSAGTALDPPQTSAAIITEPYSKQLPASLSPTVYHIERSVDFDGLRGHHHYLKAKDLSTMQNMYIWRATKRHRYQIPSAMMWRAAEHGGDPAISIIVTPVDPRKVDAKTAGGRGRDLTLTSQMGTIVEKMDRQHKLGWGPRRFSYGGRQFVWKAQTNGILNRMFMELWEVKRVWPKPGSKTGKMLDEVVGEKLMWAESHARQWDVARFYFKGGMDQFFRELLLASQLTQHCVHFYGHK